MQKDKPTECLIISLAKLMMNHSKRNDYKKVNSSFWHLKRVLCTPSRIMEIRVKNSLKKKISDGKGKDENNPCPCLSNKLYTAIRGRWYHKDEEVNNVDDLQVSSDANWHEPSITVSWSIM